MRVSLKVYEILEGAKSAEGLTSGINFVSLDRLRSPHYHERIRLMIVHMIGITRCAHSALFITLLLSEFGSILTE